MIAEIWNIFEELNNYLVQKNKERGAIFNYYKYNSDGKSYLLVPFNAQNLKNTHSKLRVMPIIDGEFAPSYTHPFEWYTKPSKRFNAFAYIYAGHKYDRFRISRGGPIEKKLRIDFVVNELIPLFLNDMNEFLSTKTIHNKALKAEIVNSKYNLFDDIYHEKPDEFARGCTGWPYCIKLAIAILYK